MSSLKNTQLNSGTILVVDDEKELRELIAEMLLAITSDVQTAANGKEALEIIRSGKVDAVLSDINMPVMNGLQLLGEVRHLSIEIPIVMLTAYADKSNMLEALRLDATDFLEKPFNRATLLETMGRAVKLGVAVREIEKSLDILLVNSALPPEAIIKQREMRRALAKMKIEHSIYVRPRDET